MECPVCNGEGEIFNCMRYRCGFCQGTGKVRLLRYWYWLWLVRRRERRERRNHDI